MPKRKKHHLLKKSGQVNKKKVFFSKNEEQLNPTNLYTNETPRIMSNENSPFSESATTSQSESSSQRKIIEQQKKYRKMSHTNFLSAYKLQVNTLMKMINEDFRDMSKKELLRKYGKE